MLFTVREKLYTVRSRCAVLLRLILLQLVRRCRDTGYFVFSWQKIALPSVKQRIKSKEGSVFKIRRTQASIVCERGERTISGRAYVPGGAEPGG